MSEHFSKKELMCKCGCGKSCIDTSFLQRLEDLRIAFGRPMFVASGYRCPEHNIKVSHTGINGPHPTGMAVDVSISGPDAYDLLMLAMQMGFTGIGIKQSGNFKERFLHIDDLPVVTYPRPRVWSY